MIARETASGVAPLARDEKYGGWWRGSGRCIIGRDAQCRRRGGGIADTMTTVSATMLRGGGGGGGEAADAQRKLVYQ
jgi:hypothetical protein